MFYYCPSNTFLFACELARSLASKRASEYRTNQVPVHTVESPGMIFERDIANQNSKSIARLRLGVMMMLCHDDLQANMKLKIENKHFFS